MRKYHVKYSDVKYSNVKYSNVKYSKSVFRVVLTRSALTSLWLIILCLSVATPLFARENPAPVVEATAQAQGVVKIEERLTTLERKLDSQTLVEMLTRLDQLQKEMQRLAGDIELINHKITGITKRQRDLYVDLDRRISQIEKASATSQQSVGGAAASLTASGASGSSDGARKAYEKAFQYLKDRRYDKAISEFQAFLRKYTNTNYANKAQYWLGEANYVQQNYIVALSEFTKVIARYPKSAKRPDAMLKMGYIYDTLGKKDKSIKILKDIIAQFPDATAARLAKKRLKTLK